MHAQLRHASRDAACAGVDVDAAHGLIRARPAHDGQVARSARPRGSRIGRGASTVETHEDPRVSGEGNPGEARRAGPAGEVVVRRAEARGDVAERLGGGTVVVKAQIHAGGRGKGGGVKVAKGPTRRRRGRGEMLGMTLVTHQTGPAGRGRARVLVEQGLRDRRASCTRHGASIAPPSEPVMMVSPDGGMEIEKVAEETPERIFKESIHPGVGLVPFQARKLAFALGLEGTQVGQAVEAHDRALRGVHRHRRVADRDQSAGRHRRRQPAGARREDELRRQRALPPPDIKELRDLAEEDPLEVEASKFSLNYIKLDGTIGCMVNGAGLAMATMDIIKLAGGEPANFLDVGGGANAEQIRNAFKILMSDKNVKAVLINIFGGILRCDVLAAGRDRRGAGARRAGADRHPDGRHERRAGQADAARERPELHDRRHDGRGGREGRRAGASSAESDSIGQLASWYDRNQRSWPY